MFAIESAMKKYEKNGNRDIFPRYFERSLRLDTAEFCSIVQALPTKLAGRMLGLLIDLVCVDLYKGPLQQGLTGGMNFLIEFHNLYTVKALNTDFKNVTQVLELQTNPTYVKFRNPLPLIPR
jgi:hypothetical protein